MYVFSTIVKKYAEESLYRQHGVVRDKWEFRVAVRTLNIVGSRRWDEVQPDVTLDLRRLVLFDIGVKNILITNRQWIISLSRDATDGSKRFNNTLHRARE